ncbi:hypothetical protein WJX84_008975 [Apatococcus fuscideae]|uniref:Uncharacterized protein n=1 Tax=Apatococcus fuscideae TaxID=2026836 RepID=A0AAW1TBP4_9CHLO
MPVEEVSVVPRSQLDAIRAKLQDPIPTTKEEERLRLKHLSQDRASRWTDTIQAQRTRRERSRQDRLEALEAERQEAN